VGWRVLWRGTTLACEEAKREKGHRVGRSARAEEGAVKPERGECAVEREGMEVRVGNAFRA
jgi:hypothetical protein